MHSHQRTLLSSLGFNDADKSNPLHDWACQYLAVPDIRLKVARMVFPGKDFRIHGAMFERLITKGEGQYATTIGFIDVCFHLVFPSDEYQDEKKWKYGSRGGLCVEVKIDPVPVGEVIRQINLYKEYNYSLFKEFLNHYDLKDWISGRRCLPVKWILATHFVYDGIDVHTLKGSGIHPVFLGQAFDDWCEKRRNPNQ